MEWLILGVPSLLMHKMSRDFKSYIQSLPCYICLYTICSFTCTVKIILYKNV